MEFPLHLSDMFVSDSRLYTTFSQSLPVGFLGCKCILLAHGQLLSHQDSQVFLCQAIFPLFGPQHILLHSTIPPQDVAFPFPVGEILVGSLLQSVEIPSLCVYTDKFLKWKNR